MIDFEALHDKVKDAIEAQGFTHIPVEKWINRERGIPPATWLNKSFSIKMAVDPDEQNTTQSDKWYIVKFDIEFMLDTINDNHWEVVGDTVTAVLAGRDAITGYKHEQARYTDWKAFTTDNFGRYLIQPFTNCYVKIREA